MELYWKNHGRSLHTWMKTAAQNYVFVVTKETIWFDTAALHCKNNSTDILPSKICFSINFKRFFIQRNYLDRKVTSNEKQSKLDSGMIMIKGIAFNDLSLKVKFIPGKVDVNMHNKIFIIIILQHISQNKMNTWFFFQEYQTGRHQQNVSHREIIINVA